MRSQLLLRATLLFSLCFPSLLRLAVAAPMEPLEIVAKNEKRAFPIVAVKRATPIVVADHLRRR